MKKLICLLICAALCVGCFAGCQEVEELISEFSSRAAAIGETEQTVPSAPTDTEAAEPIPTFNSGDSHERLGFTDFDSRLIGYLKLNGLENQNFTFSPLSFKAALALAALGAEGETQRQLLSAMGFRSVDEMTDWYASVLGGVDAFGSWFEQNSADRGDAVYEILNSVWKNQDLPGEFTEDYTAKAEELLRAVCNSAYASQLTDAINNWVDTRTRGLIPSLVDDVSNASAVLVNALYLKAGWTQPFQKIGTDIFTTASGDKVDKTYMRITDRFRYYQDDETQLVAIPLQGGLSMVFVLGSGTDVAAKLARASYTRVEVTVPMFDVETSLNQRELCNYLISLGCAKPLSADAEFGAMFTEGLYIEDIIQKAKVHIDEEGLEAAAATAIVMLGTTAIQPDDPKVFRADHDFTFCIVSESTSTELLFWGQLAE